MSDLLKNIITGAGSLVSPTSRVVTRRAKYYDADALGYRGVSRDLSAAAQDAVDAYRKMRQEEDGGATSKAYRKMRQKLDEQDCDVW